MSDYEIETRDSYAARCLRPDCGWYSNVTPLQEDAVLSAEDHMNWHNQQDQAAAAEEVSPSG